MSNPNFYQRDIDEVLTNALERGVLCEEWDACNFIANWEYTHSLGPRDFFEHHSSHLEISTIFRGEEIQA